MNAFDLIILAVLIALTLRGVMKGMVSQIVSVGSYIVCWIVASRFAFLVAPSIPAEEPWNHVGAMIVLFIITMIAIRFAHSLLEKWVKDLHLQKLNLFLGGTLGFVKGLLICMVLTFFGVMLSEATRSMVFESKSGLPISELITKTGAFIPQDSYDLLREQIDSFNAKVSGKIPESDPANVTENSLFAKLSTDANDPSSEKSTGFTDFFSRSLALLDEADSLRSDLKTETQGAVSLMDGIRRWWNGTETEQTTEPNPVDPLQKIQSREEVSPAKSFFAETVLPAVTKFDAPTAPEVPMRTALQTPSPPAPVETPTTAAPTVAPISSLYQDEAMIRRSVAVSSEPVAEQLVSLLPQTSTEIPPATDPLASQAMAIPRSSAPFRFSRRSSEASSQRLLDSTNSTGASTGATLYSK